MGWHVTSPAGQAVPLRGMDRALAEKEQRAIVLGINRQEDRHAYVSYNAVGGDHIPHVCRMTVYQAQRDALETLSVVASWRLLVTLPK